MPISFGRFSITFRRYRLPIVLLNFIVFFLFLTSTPKYKQFKNGKRWTEKLENNSTENGKNVPIEFVKMRLAFLKWKDCLVKKIDSGGISLNDLDPTDSRFPLLKKLIEKRRHFFNDHSSVEFGEEDPFERMWSKLEVDSIYCREHTNVWHIEHENVPSSTVAYILPDHKYMNSSATVVRIGINSDLSTEFFLKSVLNSKTEFFGAYPPDVVYAKLYEKIGKFFPFNVGTKYEMKKTLRTVSDNKIKEVGVKTFFKNMVRRNLIDHLIFENNEREYDMMSHLESGGSLEKAGITVCQINVEYPHPYNLKDPRRKKFVTHILNFLRDNKYVIIKATNLGSLKVFWLNISSLECTLRYVKRFFKKDIF